MVRWHVYWHVGTLIFGTQARGHVDHAGTHGTYGTGFSKVFNQVVNYLSGNIVIETHSGPPTLTFSYTKDKKLHEDPLTFLYLK